MSSPEGKRVTVMGLGLHGGAVGTIAWLHSQGAIITVTDMKTEQQLQKSIDALRKYIGIRYVLGRHEEADFTNADMIIRNPSVPRTSPFLALARRKGIPIEMDSSLFFEHSPSRDIIGVTGSKGKTTTANAITIMLASAIPETVAVGVDGVSPLGELKNVRADAPVVFELSSWRLEALVERKKSPSTAVLTSLYKDHLNTYSSFEEYISIKKGIFTHQGPKDIVLLNGDDPLVRSLAPDVQSRLFWYSTHAQVLGDGIFILKDMVTIKIDGITVTLFPLTHVPTPFEHEQRNLLPAILLGFLRGMTIEQITYALKLITRLPHRLETVGVVRDVTYINDSAATMPDATIAALSALKEKSIIHILGGSDKALEFEELAKKEQGASVKALVWLPGNATDRMKDAFMKQGVSAPMYDASSMEDAVQQASDLATTGDVVLMSPGATSFGLFLHEFDRGTRFVEAVSHLTV